MRVLFFAIAAAFFLLSAPSQAATATVETELKALVDSINAKIGDGPVTEQDLAPDLKKFDEILARHSAEKSDAVAEVLLMKAILYLQVINDPAKAEKLLTELQTKFPDSKPAAAVAEILPELKAHEAAQKIQAALQVGMTFPNFEVKGIDGNPISVTALKGKVVLIDFWATWCMPCVAELPDVRAAYEKYHDKGFDIIGVSLDQDQATLTRFLKRSKIDWPQYFDGQGFDNELAVKYGVMMIPSTFLLDKNGKILARDLRGEELDDAVAHALGGN